MAGAFDNDSVDVCINQTGLLNHEFSRSFFSTQHQHRHCQFRFGKLREVLCVLFEVAEDFETCTHRTGLRVRSCIESAIRFRNRMLGVSRKIIPEVLEIDSFATSYQLQRRNTVKVKVPE